MTGSRALVLMGTVDAFVASQFRFVPASRFQDAATLLTIGDHQWVWMPFPSGLVLSLCIQTVAFLGVAVLGVTAYKCAQRLSGRFGHEVEIARR